MNHLQPLVLVTGLVACQTNIPSQNYGTPSLAFRDLAPKELKLLLEQRQGVRVVDVRSPKEYLAGHLPGAVSIPYSQLPYRYKDLEPKSKVVLYCRDGLTSVLAAQYLSQLGFVDLYNMAGGFSAWEYSVELSQGGRLL